MTITGPNEPRVTDGFSSLNWSATSGRVFVTSAVKIAFIARTWRSSRPACSFVITGRRLRSRSCESTGSRSKRLATASR